LEEQIRIKLFLLWEQGGGRVTTLIFIRYFLKGSFAEKNKQAISIQ
jgi:hypothetical protein